MTVDSDCSVVISSLGEGDCQPTKPPTTESTTDNTGVIIGGVVAVILIFALTMAVVTITLKYYRAVNKQKEWVLHIINSQDHQASYTHTLQ